MPQMSPLLWSNLFIIFSLLLLVSALKMFFISRSEVDTKKDISNNLTKENINWMW